jgi:hypothetical protein
MNREKHEKHGRAGAQLFTTKNAKDAEARLWRADGLG